MTGRTALHEAIYKAIDSEESLIGDFWGILTALGIEPELKLLNYLGSYNDRFRTNMNDHRAISLDISVRSRLRQRPLKQLSEFIKHLKLILEDAETIREKLEKEYGIKEDEHGAYGFSVMKGAIGSKLDDILVDPIAFSNKFENGKYPMILFHNTELGDSIMKAIEETKKELLQGE